MVTTAALAAACGAEPQPAAPVTSPYRATATVRDLMQSVVAPNAQGLWDAVGTVSDAKGTFDLAPKTDAEWAAVRRHAVALVESTNLLMIPGRHVAPIGAKTLRADDADPGAELAPADIEKRMLADWSVWTAMAQTLHEAGVTILGEVDKRDADGLLRTGSDLDAVCESCHLKFWYPPRTSGMD